MEWEWKPERQNQLGALGLAGICRETSRVVRRAILPNFDNLYPPTYCLSLFLLFNAIHAHVICDPDLNHRSSLLSLVVLEWVRFFFLELMVLAALLLCTVVYMLCVASLYRRGCDHLATERLLREGLPVVPFMRLAFTFLLVVVPFFVFFSSLFALAYLGLEIDIALPLRLLGWAGVAYLAVVGQLACVVSALEDAALFAAIRWSRELLAGKFWAAAGVLVTLDGCITTVLKAFLALVVDDALGLGRVFQVPAGAAMFVALFTVLVIALVAPPVVYVVCRSHHQEVINKALQEPSTATTKGVKLQQAHQ